MNGELLDSSHVWILPHYHHPHWWEVEQSDRPHTHGGAFPPCSNEYLRGNLSGVLFVDTLKYNVFQESYAEQESDVYTLVSKEAESSASTYSSTFVFTSSHECD